MNHNYFWRSLLMWVLFIFLVSCASVPVEKVCTADKDCVPATCCHASDAVNKESAPDCKGQLCTMECVPDTLDCSQGKVACIKGECKIILNK
ncbi:hypothetical protein HZC32_00925 [Candidatus Woesearchaeota archaeon]|nr:hypothetical protein [Candidatus Woesearchaeota archaeon]